MAAAGQITKAAPVLPSEAPASGDTGLEAVKGHRITGCDGLMTRAGHAARNLQGAHCTDSRGFLFSCNQKEGRLFRGLEPERTSSFTGFTRVFVSSNKEPPVFRAVAFVWGSRRAFPRKKELSSLPLKGK